VYLTTKSGQKVYLPTPDEDAKINAGIAADDDAHELDSEWFAKATPASDVFTPGTYAALVAMKRSRGRPKAETPKVFTAISLDADVLAALKATGKGWQTRGNDALREWVNSHPTG